ncbi:hypothetical protein K7472_11300 [Streptomyces sp. PTM05]|uniref:Uncharacterized protein n=1 Tax=Streptantibioticus parmotrematis TaxID=2873249 RepID=A0ABS7QQG7_9ACTN|nr:hypothetical protein [Streptantibioticus parmotrematis]MBY8885433.1 hypothetical protein [Streptantibioticus parmotrematis]
MRNLARGVAVAVLAAGAVAPLSGVAQAAPAVPLAPQWHHPCPPRHDDDHGRDDWRQDQGSRHDDDRCGCRDRRDDLDRGGIGIQPRSGLLGLGLLGIL